jgi:hypothetical protein
MGRTVPTSTALLEEELGRWAKFRRALRREDRAVLDWLFERARYHSAPAAYLSRRTPFDALVLAMLIEVVKLVRSSCPVDLPDDAEPAPLPPGEGGRQR